LLVCLSHLLVDFPEIVELDMNPVIVADGKPCAVDARVLLRKAEVPSPHHLVISPYPEQFESRETTSGGLDIFVRPIKPEDAPLLLDLFESLSSRSRYYRFFSPMKSLSHDMLIQLTQIDYDRHIALVAFGKEKGQEKMLGVARVITGADRDDAKFSVAVGDPWQGKGVGRMLMRKSVEVAKDYGIERVHGDVLGENKEMLKLGREMGFKVSRGEEASEYHLNIE
jgi:acetyltransferase